MASGARARRVSARRYLLRKGHYAMSGVGDAITSVVNTVGSVLQPIAEVGLPILETAIGQPELILPTEAAFGGLNLGEGIANQRPFGQIAEQLGLETAGAAVG